MNKKVLQLAMEIFELTKSFPKEEKYSLVDQIRRSSRSVCACIAESYRKRQYEVHFIAKISDSDMEISETQVWLDFSLACKYIDNTQYNNLLSKSDEVGRLLNHMIKYPKRYTGKN